MRDRIETEEGAEYAVDVWTASEPWWKRATATAVLTVLDGPAGRRLPRRVRQPLADWAGGVLVDGADIAIEVVDA